MSSSSSKSILESRSSIDGTLVEIVAAEEIARNLDDNPPLPDTALESLLRLLRELGPVVEPSSAASVFSVDVDLLSSRVG